MLNIETYHQEFVLHRLTRFRYYINTESVFLAREELYLGGSASTECASMYSHVRRDKLGAHISLGGALELGIRVLVCQQIPHRK